MNKFFRMLLPSAMLLAAVGLYAQSDLKLHGKGEASSAEQLAKAPVRGYVAPRVKSGATGSLTSLRTQSRPVTLRASGPMRENGGTFEYVADLKGMVFGTPSTTLNSIAPDGTLTPNPSISLSTGMCVASGGYGTDDTYYVTLTYAYPGFNIFYAFAYDTETWQMLPGWPRTVSQRFMSTDLTYDPSDGLVYGCFTNDDATGYEFGTVNFADGERATISALPAAWNAIAADKQGNLYAIDMEGTLLKVNKENGETTEVGATGFEPQNLSSATFDHKTGKLYWTVSTDTEGFYCEVDTETGSATKIADFPAAEEVYGLYVLPPEAEDRAPAAPTNLSLNFVDASLSGTLTFDAPATLFRGEAGEGEMNYRVMSDGEQLATGSTTYGATGVETPEFSVPAPGRYTFTLYCSNDEGDSPKAEIEKFIGADAPIGVSGATASYADGIFTVTWNAPAASANGGYINPDEVTYTVTRMPDNVVVAEGIKDTSVTDAVAVPESFVKYKYAIQAEYDGYKSMTVNTNGIGLGNILPPFTDDFSDMTFVESYTTIDGNGDGRCWGAFIGMAQGMGPVYGSENSTADEWLITPAVRLEGGKFYKFGIDAATMGSTWTENFDVVLGTSPDVEGMTETFISGAEVSTSGFMETKHFEEYFGVPEDGVYYIGIHYNTPENAYFLLLDNLSISEPIDAMSPGHVENLTVTPWPEGEKKVTVAFTAPSTDLQGEPLPFLDKVEIRLDDAPLHTVSDVTPGAEVSVDLDIPTSGMHKFTVIAVNGETEGRPVETEVHVGLNVPVAPATASAVCDYADGSVTISWDAVSTDIDGKTIPADEISYLIVRLIGSEQQMVMSGIKGTQYSYMPLASSTADQEFFQYAVFAQAEAGYSKGSITGMIAVGAPDGMPWVESFPNGGITHIFAAYPLDGTNGAWANYNDQSFSMGVKSYDGDNGMIGMYGPAIGDAARLFSGRIDFTGMEHPTLTFFTFNLQNADQVLDTNELTILVDRNDGNGFVPVTTFVINDLAGGVRGWAKGTVDLTEFAGMTVQLAFDAVTRSYLYTIIDLLEINDRRNNDLSLLSIQAPRGVDVDKEFEVAVEVENAGRLASGNYNVALFKGADKVSEIEGTPLEPGEIRSHKFNCTLGATDDTDNVMYAEITTPDEVELNNRSEDVTVHVHHNAYPGVRDLEATHTDSRTVELSWKAPELLSDAESVITDDFEDAETSETFPTEYGNWKFVDRDGGYIGGMRGVELPGIQTGSQQSFWVMDADHPVFHGNQSYAANSGSKYLAQMYTMNRTADSPVPCDDWIISPWLNENSQTVGFYARSYGNDETNERFQFLYSTTGNEPDDFVSVETVSAVPHEWTKYGFEVPEGARFFAIRCTSIFEFMLFIDDITYIPANASNLVLSGYNVYADGVKIADVAPEATGYTDVWSEPKTGDIRYAVSAVYTIGESKCASLTLDTSAVEGISGDNVVVEGGKGSIRVAGADGAVTVWSADGVQVYGALVSGEQTIRVNAGVYMVRYAGRTAKVMVR